MCLATLVLFFSLTIFQHHINENSNKEVAEEAGKTLRSVLQNATQLQHQSSADLQQGFDSLVDQINEMMSMMALTALSILEADCLSKVYI